MEFYWSKDCQDFAEDAFAESARSEVERRPAQSYISVRLRI
jgi:hypothetical protein